MPHTLLLFGQCWGVLGNGWSRFRTCRVVPRQVSEGALTTLVSGVWIQWLKHVSGQFLVFVLQLFLHRSSSRLFHFNYFSYYIILRAVVDTTAYDINLMTCICARITVKSCLVLDQASHSSHPLMRSLGQIPTLYHPTIPCPSQSCLTLLPVDMTSMQNSCPLSELPLCPPLSLFIPIIRWN